MSGPMSQIYCMFTYFSSTIFYCKRGYFRWGKFRENVGKTFHVGVIFTILLIFPS